MNRTPGRRGWSAAATVIDDEHTDPGEKMHQTISSVAGDDNEIIDTFDSSARLPSFGRRRFR
jgi:hypothetical protein